MGDKEIETAIAIINGSLDRIELDNTSDVIEKSDVLSILNDIKKSLTNPQPHDTRTS